MGRIDDVQKLFDDADYPINVAEAVSGDVWYSLPDRDAISEIRQEGEEVRVILDDWHRPISINIGRVRLEDGIFEHLPEGVELELVPATSKQ